MHSGNAYLRFMELLDFPKLAREALQTSESQLLKSGNCRAFLLLVNEFMRKGIPFQTIQPQLDELAKQSDIHPYTLLMLFQLCCCESLEEKYQQKDLSFEIFKSSLMDLRYKLLECYDVFGIWGNATGTWFERFFNVTRFALGRLQYETIPFRLESYENYGVSLKKDDTVINIHIPSSGPLTAELCMDSYKQAYEFFKNEQRDGLLVLVCLSWLLYPPHFDFLPKKSNILRFMNDFDIIDSYTEEQFVNGWRVFGKYHTLPPAELPEENSLKRAYKKHLLSSGKTGWGYGVIVLGPDGIVR